MSGLCWNAAPDPLPEVLRRISRPLEGTGFYLAGGTALALLEGHRVSVDLDLFHTDLEDPEGLARRCRRAVGDLEVTLIAPETLYLDVDGVSVSFFGVGSSPLVAPVRHEPDLVPLAHRDDLAAMKLAAVASRGSRKDFVDLWWLLARHQDLPSSLELYRRRYEVHDIGHVVRSLTFFDDADQDPPLSLLYDIDWKVLKEDLRRWVEELMADGG